ncbi:3-phosphoserine/phosphohydroxythreonine transaminase [Campylobacter sp. 19-13652]|uniref:3-phosphoserine/phosphohydroxythreonine transaminase n=1 Tax=Campylobacter sp. 19-13652 TaxID=2840180 RepID=UPI001C77F8A6|nr:3-phosphoserine/phosphohydroxythreonine transaminase [Campylobacter sp. 19-13652]BCX78827.1 phosphoserine aminotransferase [Campylobacter sp. 19-13652]
MRVINFSAGPSALPLCVLQKAESEFLSFKGKGFSIMEISHRSAVFDEVYKSTVDSIKRLYALSDEYEVLFMQGGASLQFALAPMNLSQDKRVEYADTGVWTQKAIKEVKIQGKECVIVASSEQEAYSYIPEVSFSDDAAYGYICSNNTIYGTQYRTLPASKTPLVIDASSDVLSYPIDFSGSNVGVLFAGAQKNAGISGVTLVIIRKDMLERVPQNLPTMLRYDTYANNQSMFNTPPTFAIYMLGLICEWIEGLGGLEAVKERNAKKAFEIYNAIDTSGGFYKGHAKENSRSNMNVSFNIVANPALEPVFVEEASRAGMLGLKGHKHIGGIRASIYNAITPSEVETLTKFMREFVRKHG